MPASRHGTPIRPVLENRSRDSPATGLIRPLSARRHEQHFFAISLGASGKSSGSHAKGPLVRRPYGSACSSSIGASISTRRALFPSLGSSTGGADTGGTGSTIASTVSASPASTIPNLAELASVAARVEHSPCPLDIGKGASVHELSARVRELEGELENGAASTMATPSLDAQSARRSQASVSAPTSVEWRGDDVHVEMLEDSQSEHLSPREVCCELPELIEEACMRCSVVRAAEEGVCPPTMRRSPPELLEALCLAHMRLQERAVAAEARARDLAALQATTRCGAVPAAEAAARLQPGDVMKDEASGSGTVALHKVHGERSTTTSSSSSSCTAVAQIREAAQERRREAAKLRQRLDGASPGSEEQFEAAAQLAAAEDEIRLLCAYVGDEHDGVGGLPSCGRGISTVSALLGPKADACGAAAAGFRHSLSSGAAESPVQLASSGFPVWTR